MFRRNNPYSCIEELRRSRAEVLALVLITVVLGTLLGLLTEGLAAFLQAVLPPALWYALLGVASVVALALTALAALYLHGRTESRRVRISLWLPYHFPMPRQVVIAQNSRYLPLRHARRAFMRRYRSSSAALQAFMTAYAAVTTGERTFEDFIRQDNRLLTQCLALYVLHEYGERTLGPRAAYADWDVPLTAQTLTVTDLPEPVRTNPFLQADQNVEQWRLRLPEGLSFHVAGEHHDRWRLHHRRYGDITIRWLYPLPVREGGGAFHVLRDRLHLQPKADVKFVCTRLEAQVHLRRTLLPASEPFQTWATGLLARLEETLDYDYYLAEARRHIPRNLERKIGWVPKGTTLVEMLQQLDARLDDLEMAGAVAALERSEEEPDEDFVA
jgi:hypothetical protein